MIPRLALLGVAALSLVATVARSADVSYKLEKVTDGIYCATGPGPIPAGCNSAVIVTTEGVIVVDSGHTAEAARALIKAIGTVTDQPVRYLINTHHHFDHAFGNEAFPADTQIIGHPFTRAKLAGAPLSEVSVGDVLTSLRKRIDRLSASTGKDDETKAKLAEARSYLEALTAVKPRPPTKTVSDSMTLRVGGRELRLLWLGRGHTAGDIVVYLPAERILCTGDLYNGSVGFLKDAYVEDWADTLEALGKIDADVMIAGHGPVLKKDAAQIAVVRDCFKEMARQTAALEAAGLTPEAAAPQIDLTRFAEKLPQYKNKGLAVASVSRIYEVIRERRAAAAADGK